MMSSNPLPIEYKSLQQVITANIATLFARSCLLRPPLQARRPSLLPRNPCCKTTMLLQTAPVSASVPRVFLTISTSPDLIESKRSNRKTSTTHMNTQRMSLSRICQTTQALSPARKSSIWAMTCSRPCAMTWTCIDGQSCMRTNEGNHIYLRRVMCTDIARPG